MTSVAFDMGHLILTGLVGIVIFLLQRELSCNDAVRQEILKLIDNCNEKLETHERRITDHGRAQAVTAAEVTHLLLAVQELKEGIASLRTEIGELREHFESRLAG